MVSNADYSKPWTNEATLRKAYRKHGAKTLAKKWGCDPTTIFNWLNRFGIPKKLPTGRGVSYEATYTPMRKKIGSSKRALNGEETLMLKKRAGCCQICGYDEHLKLLDVHHRDGDRLNNRETNLVVVCVMCHAAHTRGVNRIK